MSRTLALPLQRLIARAAETPRDTGDSARYRARHASAGSAQVILCDVSSSMADRVAGGTKHRLLCQALDQVYRPEHVLIGFNSAVRRAAGPAELPAPSGGTALELGLAAAAQCNPAATLVISDGEPNNPNAALAMAEHLPGTIDVIYCGDESNRSAVDFMRRLARLGCGRYAAHSWAAPQAGQPSLVRRVQLMLAGPR